MKNKKAAVNKKKKAEKNFEKRYGVPYKLRVKNIDESKGW